MVALAEQPDQRQTKPNRLRPLFTCGTSVVNIDSLGTRMTGRHFGISESPRTDHRPLAANGRADALGNALDFTPSSAITDYLYDQQYYDVISGQYYLRSRNYDPTTGTFTQQDSYTINPGDLANANLYLFTGADAVNMFDPSGDFGIMDVAISISLISSLSGIVGGVAGGLTHHSLLGVEAGFLGGFTGTAATLTSIDLLLPFAGPLALPLAFGLGGAVDSLVQDVTLHGLEALDERKTWEEVIASFVVSGAFGGAGGATLYYIRQDVASEVASMPSVWDVLGNIQNQAGVLTPEAAESGLSQSVTTLLRLYVPTMLNIGRELLVDEATGAFRNTALVPIAELLVHMAGDMFLSPQNVGVSGTGG